MLKILPVTTGAAIGIKISGHVTMEDSKTLLPEIDNASAAPSRINMLILIEDFDIQG
jgi:hypothetical protein